MNTFEEYNIEDICKLAIIIIETIQIIYFIIIFVKQFCSYFLSVVFDLIINYYLSNRSPRRQILVAFAHHSNRAEAKRKDTLP